MVSYTISAARARVLGSLSLFKRVYTLGCGRVSKSNGRVCVLHALVATSESLTALSRDSRFCPGAMQRGKRKGRKGRSGVEIEMMIALTFLSLFLLTFGPAATFTHTQGSLFPLLYLSGSSLFREWRGNQITSAATAVCSDFAAEESYSFRSKLESPRDNDTDKHSADDVKEKSRIQRTLFHVSLVFTLLAHTYCFFSAPLGLESQWAADYTVKKRDSSSIQTGLRRTSFLRG